MTLLRDRVVTGDNATVYLVDDNTDVREGLSALLESVGYRVKTFPTVTAFFQAAHPNVPSCIISDIRLPGPSGLDFQKELARREIRTPIIFITGHGDIPMSVQAMKAGAIEFLPKPVREQDLLDATQAALQKDRARLAAEANDQLIKNKVSLLSDREREVLVLVVAGRMNKHIAHELKLSEPTVKVHRRKLMSKLGARSVPDLVRIAAALALASRNIN